MKIGKPSVGDQIRDALRPTPWSQLSPLRRVRRVVGGVFALSAGAMAVSASTASSDWNITQEKVEQQFG